MGIWNKMNEDVVIVRNKAHLVEKWYCQEDGIDFDETLMLVAMLKTINKDLLGICSL